MSGLTDVAVLGGGASLEHDVSVDSARAVARGLSPERWRVWPVFIDREGAWHLSDRPSADFDAARHPSSAGVAPGAGVMALQQHGIQVVFPALHGEGGEDGRLQALLELHAVRYVGSGVAASAVALDKLRTRECLLSHGLPMADATTGRCGEAGSARAKQSVERITDKIGWPCFAKIDVSGSSYGVARLGGPDDAVRFFDSFRGRRFVAEAALHGEEISVPVCGSRDELVALPPVGIYPPEDAGYFSTKAKYDGSSVEEVPPRGLGPQDISMVQELAIRAHEALDCRHLSRTDMIVTAAGPVVLEVNTLPGLTPESLLPKCAKAFGWEFPELVGRLVEFAVAGD